jgi:hypothetical protein
MDDRKLLSPLYSGLRNTIPRPRFLGTKTPTPPPAERQGICLWIEECEARIDIDINQAIRGIDLLNEFRTRMTADVVTGKLDVREAAAELSAEEVADIVAGELEEMIEDGEVLEEMARYPDAEEADA